MVVIALLSSCQTQHMITLRPDRSALIRNSTTATGLDIRQYYESPSVMIMDTSWVGNSILVIRDIDSLGYYLPTFVPEQIKVSLRGKELSVSFVEADLLKGWSACSITFFVEQGILGAFPVKSKVFLAKRGPDLSYATIRIRRKVLKRNPSIYDFTLQLR
jgi:hypothetical protein